MGLTVFLIKDPAGTDPDGRRKPVLTDYMNMQKTFTDISFTTEVHVENDWAVGEM